MLNKSNKVYTVQTIIGIRSTLYTGVTKSVVKKDRREIRVGPKTGQFGFYIKLILIKKHLNKKYLNYQSN